MMIKKLIVWLLIFFSIVAIPFLIAAESWDTIRYILYFIGVMLAIHIHKTIIRNPEYMWYRWLVSSLIYRWHVFLFKQAFKNFSFKTTDASKVRNDVALANKSKRATGFMVKGKMVAKSGDNSTTLPGISVKIYDGNDILVKETKTNRNNLYKASQTTKNRWTNNYNHWINKHLAEMPEGWYKLNCDIN